MDDFYFENELRKRERAKVVERMKEVLIDFHLKGDMMSQTTMDVFRIYEPMVDKYSDIKYREVTDFEKRIQIDDDFRKKLSDPNLKERLKRHNFTEEEMEYIWYCSVMDSWRGQDDFWGAGRKAIAEILIRELIVEEFGDDKLLPKMPDREEMRRETERCIEEKTAYYFNQAINCGGYAFKIDQCIFPTYQDNFGKTVSSLLENFPFVRLLGESRLEDDEYLVFYRSTHGKCVGHHFVRVDDDGVVREKCECNTPKVFEDWGGLDDCPEAVFAVKKDHPMFGYDLEKVNHNNTGMDFGESVAASMKNRKNSFSYHGHDYRLKRSNDEEIFVVTPEGEKVAYVVADEEDCLVDIIENKKEYVENVSGGIIPKIVNGVLVNFEDFKKKKSQNKEDKGEEETKL